MIERHGRTREAVEETLRICRDQRILKEYLAEEEGSTIMFTLLDEQKAKKFWEEDIRQEGRAEGRMEGRVEGRAEGRVEGRAEGETLLGTLMTRLKDAGRTDDAFRAAADADYRRKLYQEFKMA